MRKRNKNINIVLIFMIGMFLYTSFACSDETLRVPVGIRDRMGQKPIYSQRTSKGTSTTDALVGKGAKKLQRIKFLLNSLSQELERRNLILHIELLGIVHAYNGAGIEYFIDNVDFVTLELPNSIVRNYFEKGPSSVKVWNKFWLGVLRELKKNQPQGGIFGVNDSAIRYPRRRLHFYGGLHIGRGMYVQFEEERKYNLRGLGQRKKEIITGMELLARLPDDIRAEFLSKKVVHIPPQKNPFGKKHLVLFEPVSDSILQLSKRLKKVLLEEFQDLGVRDEDILNILNMHLIEPLLSIYNDHDQIERMLERVRKSIRDHNLKGKERNEKVLRLLHIGGYFHNPIFQRFLTLNIFNKVIVKSFYDWRFCITDEYSPNPKFLESIEGILDHIYFSGNENEVEIDIEYFTNLITGIIRNDKDFFRRRILLAAIFDRALLAGKVWMKEAEFIERKYGKDELRRVKSMLSRLLSDLSLDELKQLNTALEQKGRVYKTSPLWILREIINLGIMEPGEMALFYVYRELILDSSLMQKVYIGTNRYNPEHDKSVQWYFPFFASNKIFEGYEPGQKIRYQGEEMTVADVRKKLEEINNDEEIFITVIRTPDNSIEITLGRKRHGLSIVNTFSLHAESVDHSL